jgi:hypothetical protein
MSSTRKDRLFEVIRLLELELQEGKKIRFYDATQLIMQKVMCTKRTATDYLEFVKSRPEFDHDGYALCLKPMKEE